VTRAGEPGQAGVLWAELGYPPLELFAEVAIGRRLLRIPAPGRSAWLSEDGEAWQRLPSAICRTQLDHAHSRRLSARLLLANRGTGQVIVRLCEVAARKLWDVAGWLGWSEVNADASIQDALAGRSNDYWTLDLAAKTLDLGPLDTLVAPALPWPGGISIVLPARGVAAVLPDVLGAIAAAAANLPPGTPWEALVIDDANHPALSLPAQTPGQIQVIRSDRRLHCGGARNLGAAHARYGLIVFCDADTILAPNYLTQHVARHLLAPNQITVSLRDYVSVNQPVPESPPDGSRDSRVVAHYAPGRSGLVPVLSPVTVYPLQQTRNWRDFGHARLLGPVDLPFMVKGNNLVVSARTARLIRFPPDFTGWGPEDICFAAKAIACGSYVIPVLSTGVFHLDHLPRSGSFAQRDAELAANLKRYAHHLTGPADGEWADVATRR
jgi:hypothetical protein